MDDFERVLAAAGVPVSRSALDVGYEASGTFLGRVWSDHRDVPVEAHVRSILAGTDPGLQDRISPATLADLLEAYARPALLVPPAVDPGARDALETLAARGYALAVVSNTMRTPGVTLRALLERYGLLGFFRHTAFSDEVGVRKPAPEIFTRSLGALGVAPEQATATGLLYGVSAVLQGVAAAPLFLMPSRASDEPRRSADASPSRRN
jgi:HAD superfamily hydrolase (TIGR01509 family)